MRANKLYANIDKCVFAAEEIKVLGCFVSRVGVRADPGKVKAIAALAKERRLTIAAWIFISEKSDEKRFAVPFIHDDQNKSFSVVCDASDYGIRDDKGRERVISFQSSQLKAAERNYPVHDKELLAMKYALVKFRVQLLAWNLCCKTRSCNGESFASLHIKGVNDTQAHNDFRQANIYCVEYKPGSCQLLDDLDPWILDQEYIQS
ncbi:Reverse transcriptase, partial [Phytophthora palmivora]